MERYQELLNNLHDRASQLTYVKLPLSQTPTAPIPKATDRYIAAIYNNINTFLALRRRTVERAYALFRELVTSTRNDRMCLGVEDYCIDPILLTPSRRNEFNLRAKIIIDLISTY